MSRNLDDPDCQKLNFWQKWGSKMTTTLPSKDHPPALQMVEKHPDAHKFLDWKETVFSDIHHAIECIKSPTFRGLVQWNCKFLPCAACTQHSLTSHTLACETRWQGLSNWLVVPYANLSVSSCVACQQLQQGTSRPGTNWRTCELALCIYHIAKKTFVVTGNRSCIAKRFFCLFILSSSWACSISWSLRECFLSLLRSMLRCEIMPCCIPYLPYPSYGHRRLLYLNYRMKVLCASTKTTKLAKLAN